jgi:hypothetical protein
MIKRHSPPDVPPVINTVFPTMSSGNSSTVATFERKVEEGSRIEESMRDDENFGIAYSTAITAMKPCRSVLKMLVIDAIVLLAEMEIDDKKSCLKLF